MADDQDELERAKGAVDTWRLGQTSARYESSGLGAATISTGRGDHGGVSYGAYQLSTNAGTLDQYLQQSRYRSQFDGLTPATQAFNEKWKELANSDPAFAQDQHDFIGRSHYGEQVEALKAKGLDLSDRGRAVQDSIWSTSVQLRNFTPRIFDEGLKEKFGNDYKLSELSDRDIVEAVQDYKTAHNSQLFSRSPNVWNGLLARAESEKAELGRLADAEAIVALSGQHRDWRLGPAPPTPETRPPLEQFEATLQNIREGRFDAPAASEVPAPMHPQSGRQPDPLADGVLRPGERGPVVGELQQNLNVQAIQDGRTPPLTVDSIYGRDTRQAVENFQLWNGLPTSGVADRATMEAVASPRRTVTVGDPADAADLNTHDDLRNRSIAAPGRGRSSPDDPDHPDHQMLEQIRAGVRKIDDGLGKPYDETSERIARGLLVACKDNRDMHPGSVDYSLTANALNRVDHVVLAKNGNIFAIEGNPNDPGDPANKRAFAPVEQLSRTPIEHSDEKLQAANQNLARARELAQQQELVRQKEINESAPRMSMAITMSGPGGGGGGSDG